jgi:hypothetical protein
MMPLDPHAEHVGQPERQLAVEDHVLDHVVVQRDAPARPQLEAAHLEEGLPLDDDDVLPGHALLTEDQLLLRLGGSVRVDLDGGFLRHARDLDRRLWNLGRLRLVRIDLDLGLGCLAARLCLRRRDFFDFRLVFRLLATLLLGGERVIALGAQGNRDRQ